MSQANQPMTGARISRSSERQLTPSVVESDGKGCSGNDDHHGAHISDC